MRMEPQIAKRIFRNILVSLFIYALPIILMLLTLYFTGQRPWEKNSKPVTHSSSAK
jgi:hypothetical protein